MDHRGTQCYIRRLTRAHFQGCERGGGRLVTSTASDLCRQVDDLYRVRDHCTLTVGGLFPDA
eukprot:3884699-Prymnesium_polylepis.1